MATHDAHAHGAPSRFARTGDEVKDAAGKPAKAISNAAPSDPADDQDDGGSLFAPLPDELAPVHVIHHIDPPHDDHAAHHNPVDLVKQEERNSPFARKSLDIAKKVGHFVADMLTPPTRDEVWNAQHGVKRQQH